MEMFNFSQEHIVDGPFFESDCIPNTPHSLNVVIRESN